MLTVTSKAKYKLKTDLEMERRGISEFARIIYSPSNPDRIGFEIDKEKEDDLVIKDDSGEKLLLLGPDMRDILRTCIIDYTDGPEGRNFIVKKYK